MEIPNITDLIFQGAGIWVLKLPILILLFLYMVFLLIVTLRINALNRTLKISAARASQILQIMAIVQLFLAVSLFLLAIVIV